MDEVLVVDHPDTLSIINNLASVLQCQSKYEEADKMHRQTLELREKALVVDHPYALTGINNLTKVLSHRGKLTQ
jgi:hypothetical protein